MEQGKGFADRKAARGDRARRLRQVRPARRGHRVVGHRSGARGSSGPVGTRERVCHRHRFARQRAHAACARGAGRRVRSTGPLGPQGQAPARRRRREHDPCLQPVRPYACGGRHRHRSAAPEGDRWGAGAGVSTLGRVCDASRPRRGEPGSAPRRCDVRRPSPPRPGGREHADRAGRLHPFENGATRVVPGSHRSVEPVDQDAGVVDAEMPAGSLLVWDGAVWHGSGENRTRDRFRTSINLNFNLSWLRQQENQYIGIPGEVTCPPSGAAATPAGLQPQPFRRCQPHLLTGLLHKTLRVAPSTVR